MNMLPAIDIISKIKAHTEKRYSREEYPALAAQEEAWAASRPLEGIRILDSTPLFTNTLLKYVPLLAAGALVTPAIHDGIPYDVALPALLKSWGMPVAENADHGTFDCVLDCGGVHASLKPVYGVGELTRSGYYHYTSSDKPVVLVDDSRTKAIETCLGTGEGFLRGMRQLGYDDFQGKSVVLFGYGKVGRGIAYYANRAGACVTVVDDLSIPVAAYVKIVDRHDRNAITDAVKKAWCVVTATGVKDAMMGNGAADALRSTDQLVAAMGIEDEWGTDLPRERVLCKGIPINFILDEPTQVRYIDPTMALHNAAALELVTKKLPAGVQKISPEVEAIYWHAVEACGLITDEIIGAGL